jgi:hypothetical protein
MLTDENTEYYLIHSMGLTREQIEEMTYTEIERYCQEVIKKMILKRSD